jgi:lipopolysaccharide transport system ATP-binding protein
LSNSSDIAIRCRGVVKRFYRYEQRTRTLREFFIRSVRGRPITVRYPEFTLSGLDLEIAAGEAVALIGPNGSGKSTALRLMAGIYEPSEGTVDTFGSITAVIELGASFNPELTGIENVRLYSSVLGFASADIEAAFPDIIAFADIGDFINEPVKYYSSGMQARLAFAVAVCAEPDILLLDEVLAVGDQAFRARCFDRIRQFHQSGRTLVTVTHDLNTIRSVCTRAVWLDRGQVRMDGDIDEVIDAYLDCVKA